MVMVATGWLMVNQILPAIKSGKGITGDDFALFIFFIVTFGIGGGWFLALLFWAVNDSRVK
ncbi:MAG: hypothetical protein AB1757_10345 [Acidobacteriota bacterium]